MTRPNYSNEDPFLEIKLNFKINDATCSLARLYSRTAALPTLSLPLFSPFIDGGASFLSFLYLSSHAFTLQVPLGLHSTGHFLQGSESIYPLLELFVPVHERDASVETRCIANSRSQYNTMVRTAH